MDKYVRNVACSHDICEKYALAKSVARSVRKRILLVQVSNLVDREDAITLQCSSGIFFHFKKLYYGSLLDEGPLLVKEEDDKLKHNKREFIDLRCIQ